MHRLPTRTPGAKDCVTELAGAKEGSAKCCGIQISEVVIGRTEIAGEGKVGGTAVLVFRFVVASLPCRTYV